MPIDLSQHTFLPCLIRRGRLNMGDSDDGWFKYGCILDRRFKLGRPGVAGEYRPQMRDGAGDHATIYVRDIDPVRREAEGLAVGSSIYVETEPNTGKVEEWRIRGVKGPVAGAWEYLCELAGSRALDTSRGGENGPGNRN